ncbi:intradiol ring-cleavage dioxygenase [Aspergillus stella-maris]|uniref:intradiol ring-cleavage dioxygenase n=1 Tax=Aspergillus stella-maris TaxID=1810926 RepID=UPI003CCE1D65
MRFSSFFALTAATLALAHPGEKHDPVALKREIHARDVHAVRARQAIDTCSNSDEAVQLRQRNVARRARTTRELREKRGITANPSKWRRDLAALEEWEAIDHNKTGILNYAPDTRAEEIFGGNTSAILSPTVTDGPYYIWGELTRQDVREDLYSDGVDLFLEVQYIDVNTCLPIEGAIVDIWNANATGVYSGVVATGNEAADGWDSTYLRGIQESDKDGIVTFQTIFPGHYDGRAIHTHLLTHIGSKINKNNGTLSIGTGSVAHIGQLFWNEVLRSAVEETTPYNQNTQAITTNADDMWSIEQATDEFDPFPEYVYLGNGVEDGLFAWIQIGINATADYTDNSYYSIAGYYGEDGGYQNADSGAMGGGGGGDMGAPSGSMSGAIPSGTAPPSA